MKLTTLDTPQRMFNAGFWDADLDYRKSWGNRAQGHGNPLPTFDKLCAYYRAGYRIRMAGFEPTQNGSGDAWAYLQRKDIPRKDWMR